MIECNVTLQLHCITAKQRYIKLIFLPASKIFIWKGHKKSHKNRMWKEMWMRGVGKERRSELATISYKFSFPPRKLQGVKTVTGNKRSQCFFFFFEETCRPSMYLPWYKHQHFDSAFLLCGNSQTIHRGTQRQFTEKYLFGRRFEI